MGQDVLCFIPYILPTCVLCGFDHSLPTLVWIILNNSCFCFTVEPRAFVCLLPQESFLDPFTRTSTRKMQPINTLLLLASAASTAFGATWNVQVAVDKTLTYTPNSINAAVGDQIEFDFLNGVCSSESQKSSFFDGIIG